MLRKSVHLLVAIVPMIASIDVSLAVFLLASGILFYTIAEKFRLAGAPIKIIGDITILASREPDSGRFVLGPVTLGLGALLSLLLYPWPAATIAIYALAFGDGFASLAGTLLKGPKIPMTCGKTFSGSFACLLAVFLITLRLTANPKASIIIAFASAVLEALPSGDFDNLILPVGAGFIAQNILL